MLDPDKIDELSVEDLDAEIIRAANAEAPKDYRRAVTAAYDRAVAAGNARRLAASLSDSDKVALLQHIAPDGTGTTAVVGIPGEG